MAVVIVGIDYNGSDQASYRGFTVSDRDENDEKVGGTDPEADFLLAMKRANELAGPNGLVQFSSSMDHFTADGKDFVWEIGIVDHQEAELLKRKTAADPASAPVSVKEAAIAAFLKVPATEKQSAMRRKLDAAEDHLWQMAASIFQDMKDVSFEPSETFGGDGSCEVDLKCGDVTLTLYLNRDGLALCTPSVKMGKCPDCGKNLYSLAIRENTLSGLGEVLESRQRYVRKSSGERVPHQCDDH